MTSHIEALFNAAPLLALFITLALGYIAGKLTIGRFVLGGIAGTLLMGVLMGQFNVQIDSGIKSIFFALFIYAVGYQGGPQFAQALNLKSLNQLISAFVMCASGLACVLLAAWWFNLDRGTAAGLAAGGLTQSAIIGTAGDAIAKLDVSAEAAKTMQTNVAVGYAVCYIFGSLGPIIMATWFFPMVMGWDIRAEAKKREQEISGDHPALEPGEFNAIERIATRVYRLDENSDWRGMSVEQANRAMRDAAVEGIYRNGELASPSASVTLERDDLVILTGQIESLHRARGHLGDEVEAPDDSFLVEEERDIVLSNKQLVGKTVGHIHDHVNIDVRSGVYLKAIRRMGHELPVSSDLELHRGDELLFTGRPQDLDRALSKVGYKISAAAVTDFIFFGIGMAFGILLGMIEFRIAGIPVTIGSGGGCLLSGLLFGWLRSTHPRYAALPTGASNFLRDFGLAVFVGIVGLSAGPQALTTIQEQGLTLLLLGAGVTILPQLFTFYFSYYVLQIKNPIDALGCLVGGRSANPGFAALLEKAGNATPVVPFTVTYAVANVFLTLWGPIIVGVVSTNP
ncbi:MAG: aspartate-alanine antiporter [Pseudomonadota bacterium]